MQDGSWLTAVRVQRFPAVLRSIHSQRPPGLPVKRAQYVIWTVCGGPFDEVLLLVRVLQDMGLVAERDGCFALSKNGRLVATQDHQRGGREIALAIIRRGLLADQARRLVESSRRDPADGVLICRRTVAQRVAPQLAGLLLRWPDVTLGQDLRVPPELVQELLDVWSLLPKRQAAGAQYKTVGDRAELYSYRLERLSAEDPTQIRWVSLENDDLGYDVEDVGGDSRRIEVKGSAGAETRFFLSENELRVARIFGERYEVHFWGSIDLSRAPEQEYDRLRQLGFPRRFPNIAKLIDDGAFTATPQKYLVVAATTAGPQT